MTFRRFCSVALAVAWRNLHNFFSSPALFLPGLLFPLFFFTAFAGGLSSIGDAPGFEFPPGYTAFQYVFVLFQSAAFSGVFNGFAIARDFESGFTRRLFVAAPGRSGVLGGYVLAALGRWAFTATVVTVVALLVGMTVIGGPFDLFGLYVLAALTNIAASLWAAGLAMRTRTVQAGPAMQLPVFAVLFLAPVYVPLNLLEGWINTVARANPATYLLEASRGLLADEPVYLWIALAAALGLGALFLIWAVRGLRRAEAAG